MCACSRNPHCVAGYHTPACYANVVLRQPFESRKRLLQAAGFTYTDAMGQALFEELGMRIARLEQQLLTKPNPRRARSTKKTTKKTNKKTKRSTK